MGWHRKSHGLAFVFEDATIDSVWGSGRGSLTIPLEVQVRAGQLWGIAGPSPGDQGFLELGAISQTLYLTPVLPSGERMRGRLVTFDWLDAGSDWEAFLVWLDEAMEETGQKLGDFEAATPPVCWKCGGSGKLPEYNHIDRGVCYACGGTGRAWPRKLKPKAPENLKPWRTGVITPDNGHITRIKEWLAVTPAQLKYHGNTEQDRWYQVGLSAAYCIFDPAMYPRVVKRAFEYARASPWPEAVATLTDALNSNLSLISLGFDVPLDRRDGFGVVPGVFTPSEEWWWS